MKLFQILIEYYNIKLIFFSFIVWGKYFFQESVFFFIKNICIIKTC